MSDRVCAVIVTHERVALLRRCLDAVLAQARLPDAVVVVDNASTDGTAGLLASAFPAVHVLSLPSNVGSAGAFHRGMAAALGHRPDWIWLMDDDVIPDHHCLGEMLEVAAAAGKQVVVPRRVDTAGRDCENEAVLLERAQRFEVVAVDPERERYRLVDLFTFEGPLIHRAVVEAVGLPNPNVFIRGEDLLYAVAINRRRGPLSCALAGRAVMRRQLRVAEGIHARSRLKGLISDDARYEVFRDEDHWKYVYELRNRHLVWRALGWRRRRHRLLVVHLGYVAVDLVQAMRRGWNWPLRLRCNVAAWYLGALGRDTPFLDPLAYRARLAASPRARTRPAA